MRRKQQELEDRVAYNLAQAERDREQQIRKVNSVLCCQDITAVIAELRHDELKLCKSYIFGSRPYSRT